MATRKQKEELMQTLKFTPVKATISIGGYGGECYIGSVDRKTYDYFKSKRIDLEQYVNDWDGLFDDVPQEHRFCDPESPYDCDNLFHNSGATMDDSGVIEVVDENNNVIWSSTLDITALEDAGITVVCNDSFESADLNDGDVIFWGGQGEKGCFFSGEFTLRAPFDPAKLTVSYGDGDGWLISSGVEYDGEDIEGYDGYNTTGKWAEHKFWIKGDEEVYQGRERSEDSDDEEEESQDWDPAEELKKICDKFDESKSPWFDVSETPIRKGLYECELRDSTWPFPAMCEWTGRSWKEEGKKITNVARWRGLDHDPALD